MSNDRPSDERGTGIRQDVRYCAPRFKLRRCDRRKLLPLAVGILGLFFKIAASELKKVVSSISEEVCRGGYFQTSVTNASSNYTSLVSLVSNGGCLEGLFVALSIPRAQIFRSLCYVDGNMPFSAFPFSLGHRIDAISLHYHL